MERRKLSIFAFSLFIGANLFAELIPYEANYAANFGKFSGYASMNLKKDQTTNTYNYSTYTKGRGLLGKVYGSIRESVAFTIEQNKVRPIEFNRAHRSDRERINYDWSTRKAQSLHEGEKKSLDLYNDELDVLSLQLQLMHDLNNDSIASEYKVIADNKIKTYEIKVIDKETITVFGKAYETIKIKQQRKGSSRQNFLWLAPDMQHVIVKMQQFKGKELRASIALSSYKAKPLVKPLPTITTKEDQKELIL